MRQRWAGVAGDAEGGWGSEAFQAALRTWTPEGAGAAAWVGHGGRCTPFRLRASSSCLNDFLHPGRRVRPHRRRPRSAPDAHGHGGGRGAGLTRRSTRGAPPLPPVRAGVQLPKLPSSQVKSKKLGLNPDLLSKDLRRPRPPPRTPRSPTPPPARRHVRKGEREAAADPRHSMPQNFTPPSPAPPRARARPAPHARRPPGSALGEPTEADTTRLAPARRKGAKGEPGRRPPPPEAAALPHPPSPPEARAPPPASPL